MKEKALGLLKAHHEFLKNFVKDHGGCDHQVGICICKEVRLCEDTSELLNALDKKQNKCHHTWVHPGTSRHPTHCNKCGMPWTREMFNRRNTDV